jgi:LPXTG-site transpeptidase (sortase) family protein
MPSPRKSDKISTGLIWAGALFIIGAVVLFLMNFAPVINLEFNFFLKNLTNTPEESQDSILEVFSDNQNLGNFMIVIPAIDAKAKVIANVDPFNEVEYNKALAEGIAHAKYTALPGQNGNTFLFAHSGRNFYDGLHMNVQFYLLEKLVIADKIYLKYQDSAYIYEVTNSLKVMPNEIDYLLDQSQDYNKLTLMSCWPAGINYRRQIVEAKLVETIPLVQN